ncbi:MAG: Holliday junction branch migration protein RuvA [Desulfuromonas sp.]|nr:MAG: Holliday junction branch migration protein RuvA [Desulfuromonas sp.]
MIARLRGDLIYKALDHVVIDTAGVGYRLFIPLSTFYALPDSGEVSLHVHTHVKEDALQLYGFLELDEKLMFSLLIVVSGVGPKLAVNILSNIPARDLQVALANADTKRLGAVPGIGKKTAERLILELKDKVEAAQTGDVAQTEAAGNAKNLPHDDALSALVNLGYKENLARKALEALETPPEATLEEILKGALKLLVR